MRTTVNVLFIITNFFVFFGFLAKFQHWPGASIGVILGLTLSIFAMVLYLVARLINKNKVSGLPTYFVYFFFFIVAFGSNFFITNGSRDLLNAFTMLDHDSQRINNQIKDNSNSLKIDLSQDQKEYCTKVTLICSLIEKDKETLIKYSGGLDAGGFPMGKDNQDIAGSYFKYDKNEAEHLTSILAKLNGLGERIMGVKKDKLIIENLNDSPDIYAPRVNISWSSRISEHIPLSSVLANLELLKTRILQNQITILTSSK